MKLVVYSIVLKLKTYCNISPPLILSTNTVGKRKEEEKTLLQLCENLTTINIFPKQMYTVSCKAS